jgi:hypothetical protein
MPWDTAGGWKATGPSVRLSRGQTVSNLLSIGMTAAARRRPWRLEDIAFERLDRAIVADDLFTFRIVATASFIESGSDLYAGNLVEFFADDDEMRTWLAESWEPEELQHGAALRTYVEHAWPDFPWEERFRAFLAEYSPTCAVSLLEPTRPLELAARCIVEMGTSVCYRTVQESAREPVLKEIAAHIYSDEVRHYKTFYRHFRRYQRCEPQSRLRIGRTLIRRLLATRSEDGRYAYRQVWDFGEPPQHPSFERSYAEFARDMTGLFRRHLPAEMVTRMILNPLALPARFADAVARFSAPLYRLWLAGSR